jgi:hypothetical protein
MNLNRLKYNQILTLVKDLERGHSGNSGPTVGSRLALDPDSQTSPGSLVLILHTKMPQGYARMPPDGLES